MPEVTYIQPLIAPFVVILVLLSGGYASAVFDQMLAIGTRSRFVDSLLEPLRRSCRLILQQISSTERPDMMLWAVAPASYMALAACGLTVVPLGEQVAVADVRTGIVLFGAAEALAIVAIFLHGWSPNSHLPLIGGYRFVALGLSYELLSMFVLIAAALPAESMQLSAIVESQGELWNVLRQPLSLPLWIVVTMGVTFLGPFNLADGSDLCSGTSLEVSGRHYLIWQMARGSMLAVFSLMGANVLLGGWLGPVMPGWLWIIIKALALMALVIWLKHRFTRLPAERAMLYLWTVGLPLSFLHLLLAGIEAL